jgi:3-hydroxybutyryl-CoA dehydrogenase
MLIYVYDDKVRAKPVETMRGNLQVLLEQGVIEESQIEETIANVSFTESLEEAAEFADVIFECIVENLAVKQDYFKKLDELCPVSTILASNTSAISITEIAEKSEHKERIIGTHYWNPAYLIPLVEVIRTPYVSEETEKAMFELLEGAGKKPVLVKKDVPGFLANRLQHALFREAISIVENGIADPKDVDDAIKYGFGMRLGVMAPMEVMDNAGLDLTYAIHKYLFPAIESSKEPAKILVDKIEAGELGFKTNKGFQEWTDEEIAASRKGLTEGLIKVAKALDRL